MNVKKLFDPEPLGYAQMSLFILIELLLIFDKTFSKFHLFGPFYLYDFLLILLTLFSGIKIVKNRTKLLYWPILVLVGVSTLYLFYSYFILHSPVNYSVRQFAVIVYIATVYIIFLSFINTETLKFNIRFLILLGIAAFALQLAYHVYNFIFHDNFIGSLFNEFNYFSEMAFMALFLFEVYILVYISKWWKWLLIFLFLLLISTLGHQGSAIIVSSLILGLYFVLQVDLYKKYILLLAGIACIYGMFAFFPQYFLDHNSMWRYIYWKITLKDIFEHYYGIFGHGFGVQFTTPEVLETMSKDINSPWFEVRPEEKYLTPMHNSFITIAYHIGFVFMLLIFIPLKNMFTYIFKRSSENSSKEKDFLTLSMFAVMGWASFHVILELPHSSALFWLIYFSTAYLFSNNKNRVI